MTLVRPRGLRDFQHSTMKIWVRLWTHGDLHEIIQELVEALSLLQTTSKGPRGPHGNHRERFVADLARLGFRRTRAFAILGILSRCLVRVASRGRGSMLL